MNEDFKPGRVDIHIGKSNPSQSTIAAYVSRIEYLNAVAEQDDSSPCSDSLHDFWRFVFSAPFIRKGDLVLMDNGNLRAVWMDGKGTRLGLQFLGGGTVQYVIFKRRASGLSTSRVTGRDTFEGLNRQIDAFELHALIRE